MSTRVGIFVVTIIIMFVACIALAGGWMQMADNAVRETKTCEARQRRTAADVPRILITTTDIVYERAFIAKVGEFVSEHESPQRIDALFNRLVDDRRRACDPATICLDNVVILEMAQAADTRITRHIIGTAWAAGYDVLY